VAIALVDVRGLAPDAVTVDALARVQVIVRRHGYAVRLQNASAELLELVDFMGLGGVLQRQPEEREDPFRVEEERKAGDLAVDDVDHL
jgi:hypothetical protein